MATEAGLEAKVVLLGAQGVGKTCLVVRYVQGTFNASTSTTIGASFFTHKLIIGGKKLKLQIWDTAGQERFRSMAPMYYRNARGAILVYDVTSKSSFQDLAAWVRELRNANGADMLVAIVGNKVELRDKESVTREEGEAYAKSVQALFFEASAKNNEGVTEVFLHVAEALINRRLADAPAAPKDQAAAEPSKCCQ